MLVMFLILLVVVICVLYMIGLITMDPKVKQALQIGVVAVFVVWCLLALAGVAPVVHIRG